MEHNSVKDKKVQRKHNLQGEPHHSFSIAGTSHDLLSPEDDISSIGSEDMIDNDASNSVPNPYMLATTASQVANSPSLGVEEACNILLSLKEAMNQKKHEEAGKLWKRARENMWRWLIIGENGAGSVDLQKQMCLGRDLLEIGLKIAVIRKDMMEFDRLRRLLEPYYYDSVGLPPSEHSTEVTGLVLMYLLTENMIVDFHIEWERLRMKDTQRDKFLSTAFKLEQYMRQGNYSKVVEMRKDVPSPLYEFFTDRLVNTIQQEEASCFSFAYESMSKKECMQRLHMKDDIEFAEFTAAQKQWMISDNGEQVFFDKDDMLMPASYDMDMALELLKYSDFKYEII